ncbi:MULTISPECIES: Hpt domain-containing protein [Pseudomonas]|uniref:Hpt domain-containing protein n=1 Tax=Pseudomonas izuensis TaxID=2684212 RepID=A0ABM7RY56_9PSED|nr:MULTISPECIES: Hpt domain-containing protein [Pseudomonas]RKS16411.1 HPt (histidine-containing phosphotransfer) domain-containing protein [Pseudomonas sp. WPR_5_2]BCX69939.1 Hpt domain-containing protein [Pseudomonas izuensis]
MADTHLDPNVLSALREVMEDEFSTLVETFLADSEERLQQLTVAADATQILETAHSFKGSSSNMGATRLAGLCHDLEQRAKARNLSGIEALIADVAREFALIRPLYEEERQRSLSAITTVRPY